MPRLTGLYIMLISVHGLLRARDPELGRDADTGGQTTYVLELARALIEHPDVEKVDLVTRWISDPDVDKSYSQPVEEVVPGVTIVRIPCGPRRYIRKEMLWPYLEGFVDNLVPYLRSAGRAPDVIHGHYADAGSVAAQLSGLLDVPMVFTGHSLGRVKRSRLLDQGTAEQTIEKRYRIRQRIEAEETALNHAAFVVASTQQEVSEQYQLYEYYHRRRMLVVPPGVDLSRFSPPRGRRVEESPIYRQLGRFLRNPRRPMVLAISRPDPRKNIATLIRAFAEHATLRDEANLVVLAGNRDDIRAMEHGPEETLAELLYLIDRHDLYGSVAYPKHHDSSDVPRLYRLAAQSKGVFVNPALTEPFGLTLLEAAASGLPLVATDDGGPRDILAACENGLLIDALDSRALGRVLHSALHDAKRWRKWSRNGIRGSRKHFSWEGHVAKYMRAVQTAVSTVRRKKFFGGRSRLITADRVLVCDIDNTLTGDRQALRELVRVLRGSRDTVAFGVATGRSLELTLQALREWEIPTPQLLITDVGSAIHYGRRLVRDRGWEQRIRYRWRPEAARRAMAELPGLKLQSEEGQGAYKISYDVDPDKMPTLPEIRAHLRHAHAQARLVYSHGAYLDLLPIRASKGAAIRYFALHWGIPLEHFLVAGDSGNDEDMLNGNALAVVVGNHDADLDKLRDRPNVYFAPGAYARGILEGIDHYRFLGELPAPQTEVHPHARSLGH